MENKIYLGDCLEVMKDIKDSSIDMILSDLPYGITQNKWDCLINLNDLWKEFWRILKNEGVVVLTAAQPFSSVLVSSCIERFKHEWIWIKDKGSNFANVKREPMKEHEHVLIFSRGKWVYNPQLQERAESGLKRIQTPIKMVTKSNNYGKGFDNDLIKNCSDLRVPSTHQKFNIERGLHPTQKPVKLFEYLIKTYTNEEDLVLDATAGSGTTAIACINTNRKFICIEKDEEFYKKSVQRLKERINGICRK